MRKATEVDYFPYYAKSVCYILAYPDGHLEQIPHNKTGKRAALPKVLSGEAKLYAVWPGSYTSDLFEIDDVAKFISECGL